MSFETQHENYEKQMQLESSVVFGARERWVGKVAKARAAEEEADLRHGQRLIRTQLEGVEKALAALLAEANAGKASGGRPRDVVNLLGKEDLSIVAYIALRGVVDGLANDRAQTKLAITIGHRVEDQLRLERFRKKRPDLFDLTVTRIEKMAVVHRERRRTIMRLMAGRGDPGYKAWTKQNHLAVGCLLIDAVVIGSKLVTRELIDRVSRGKIKSEYTIMPTPDMQAFLKAVEGDWALMSPRYLPMVMPPKRWTTVDNGGYWSGLLKLPFILTDDAQTQALARRADLSMVFDAVNAAQETPWRINRQVLAVLSEALEAGHSVGDLPPVVDTPLPPKPTDIDSNEEARREWRARAAAIHTTNRKSQSRRHQVLVTKQTAETLRDAPAIYFPYQVDFRGRMYAVPALLNPQGADYARALLTFADGKPINDATAAGWLAIHGANCYGIDKTDLDSRIGWVEENEERILLTAQDPWASVDFWSNADKPWRFLAFCFEWAAFQAHGYGYVSTLPITLDGSCNGLQHYSALLRDEVGGAATNLVPASKPADIYAEVARVATEKVRAMLKDSADPGTPAWFAAKTLQLGIDRKVTKRAVMTLPYGSSQFSCRAFIADALREKVQEGGSPFAYRKVSAETGEVVETDGIFDASLFLQRPVWEAIGDVVKSACAGMAWLRKVASLAVASAKGAISWRTPDGFVVRQFYGEVKSRRIETHLDGRLVRLRLAEETNKVDKPRMLNGIAPNFIHSLDACALRCYVRLALANGVRHFSLVHDEYGTVAGDAAVMAECIRESFASMYEDHDVLAEFHSAIAAIVSDEGDSVPPPPARGTLDVSQVRDSLFFFA